MDIRARMIALAINIVLMGFILLQVIHESLGGYGFGSRCHAGPWRKTRRWIIRIREEARLPPVAMARIADDEGMRWRERAGGKTSLPLNFVANRMISSVSATHRKFLAIVVIARRNTVPITRDLSDLAINQRIAELPRKQLQRGVHRSTAELEADINAFIAAHIENPKPYRWAKSADEILALVKRSCQKTMSRTSDSGD